MVQGKRQRIALTLIWLVALFGFAVSAALAESSGSDSPLPPRGGSNGVSPMSGWWQMLGAMAVVIALIFALRWMLKRLGRVQGIPGRAVSIEVLSRVNLTARQQLVLVRMGRRVLLIGAGPQSATTLSEVTDTEEAEELLIAAGASAETFKKALSQAESSAASPDTSAGGEA